VEPGEERAHDLVPLAVLAAPPHRHGRSSESVRSRLAPLGGHVCIGSRRAESRRSKSSRREQGRRKGRVLRAKSDLHDRAW
jgi:hypothetical protein